MCWFVTLAVATHHGQCMEGVTSVCRGLHFAAQSSTPTTAVFPADALCVEVTHGGCSCDLYSEPPAADKIENDLAKERHCLAKKGWSPSKIQRALEAKAESASRPGEISAAAEAFRQLVRDLVNQAGEVQVFSHFYGGNQHEERVGSPSAALLTVDELCDMGFPADTLVTVRATAG